MSEADSAYGGPVLIDNSAWTRIGLGRLTPCDHARFDQAVRDREVVVSPPFAFEARYSARDAAAFRELRTELWGFPHAWAGDRTWEVAEDAQQALADAPGISHRINSADLLLAAIADQSGLGILHYDRDFDLIRDHTPLTFRSVWVAEQGSIR
jgi:predicted nucleic acid-binding protein